MKWYMKMLREDRQELGQVEPGWILSQAQHAVTTGAAAYRASDLAPSGQKAEEISSNVLKKTQCAMVKSRSLSLSSCLRLSLSLNTKILSL